MTPRQHDTLNTIARYTLDHGFPPSIAEISMEMGVHTAATIRRIHALQAAGIIERDEGRARTVRIKGNWTVHNGRTYREVIL